MHIESLLGLVVCIIGLCIFYVGRKKGNESSNLSTYVPVDTINSIPFEVPTVVNGTVYADQPLISPVTKKPCVYFEYVLEKETPIKDKYGNDSWEWKQVGPSQKQTIPFYLQDQTGKILVKPDNCEIKGIYSTQQFLQTGTIENKFSGGLKMLADAFQFNTSKNPDEGNKERVTEYTIFIGATLNVFGMLTLEGNQKFFQKTNDYPLILSPLSKEQLVVSEKKTARIVYAFSAIVTLLGLLLLFGI